ncbi:MAG TPA: PEGA domain-containing protein [Vicinamibacterales bacterium]|nr:PEGA domain-containing protein [Vicinamibacterales bacterium]
MNPAVLGSPFAEPQPSIREVPKADPPSPEKVTVEPEAAQDLDLLPQLEAMRAFLARHPTPRSAPDARISPARLEPLPPRPLAVDPAPVAVPDPPEAETTTEGDWPLGSLLQERRSSMPVLFGWRRRWGVLAAGALLLITLAVGAVLLFGSGFAGVTTGSLTVGTNPAGLAIFLDGKPSGVTPLSVDVPPGDHLIELVVGTDRRRIPVNITAGSRVSQFLELPRAASVLGELQIRTEPSQAAVSVDGRAVGRSPVSVADLTPGTHTVVLQHESGTVTQQVLIEEGKITSLVVPIADSSAKASTGAGWISIAAPADVQVFENGRLVGTNSIDRIMLPVGRHELEIANDALGYRERKTIQVTAGQVSAVKLQWAQGSLALNAIPWADVFIDEARVGETPIGSISLPIGTHDVIFRHPDLGERRMSVTVTAGQSAKVGVDMRAK